MILETSVFDNFIDFITNAAKQIGFNWIAVISFMLLLMTIIISFVWTMFSIDVKTSKAVQQVNLYLEKNPYINEENLVEFNKLMKTLPAPMRAQWQQFMVGRDKKPSQYFTDENCIEKPFKASGYGSHIVAVRIIVICIAILSFLFSCGALADLALPQVLLQSSLVSALVVILGLIYVMFLKLRRNTILFDLYYNFTNFKNYLDRAVSTLPEYVDYEILFTKKEINSGIPVLQEYLKQRAEYEQQQIKHAQESQVEHELYDFAQLGVSASIIMEKAMRECEFMLGNKKRIQQEVSELQSNLESYERTYDEKVKGTQRKLRDIQESLDRLKEKLQATTNMIVGNDLRKQRENEIEKQRQIEKESAEDTRKFEESKKQILEQIAAKKAEIETFRKNAETVLNDEFRAYSTKIYKELKDIADEQVKDELDKAHENIQFLLSEVDNRDKVIAEKTLMIDENAESNKFLLELSGKYETLQADFEQQKKELAEMHRKYDGLEPAEYEEPVEEAVEEPVEQPESAEEMAEQPVEQEYVEEFAEEPASEAPEEVVEEPAEQQEPAEEMAEQPVEQEYVEEVAEEPAEVVEETPAEEPQEELPAEEPAEEQPAEEAEPVEVSGLSEEELFGEPEAVEPAPEEVVEDPVEQQEPAEEMAEQQEPAEEMAEQPVEQEYVEEVAEEPAPEAPEEAEVEEPAEAVEEAPAEEPQEELPAEELAEEQPAEPEAEEKEEPKEKSKNKKSSKKQKNKGIKLSNRRQQNVNKNKAQKIDLGLDLSLAAFNEQLSNAINEVADEDDNK